MTNLTGYRFFFEKPGFKVKRKYKVLSGFAFAFFFAAFVRVPASSVTVGFFAGECTGYCNTTYIINNGSIGVNSFADGNNLPDIKKTIYGDFRSLKFNIPLLLLFHFTGTFGHPDNHDQGGYLLGFKLLGMPFLYKIDRGSEPLYFTDMTGLVRDRLHRIYDIANISNKNQ